MYSYIRQKQEKCPARAIGESPRVPEKQEKCPARAIGESPRMPEKQEKCPARAIGESPRVPEKTANPLLGHCHIKFYCMQKFN
jgi:hypothetical protein